MPSMKPHRLLASLFVWATLASCAQTPPAPTPASAPTPALARLPASAPEADSVRMSRELRALIGPAACAADSQCRSLPVGAKACGGPAGYLAWSTEGTDATRVTELAARQTEAQRREVQASGMRSNCVFVADPGAVCVAGHCQLAGAASAR